MQENIADVDYVRIALVLVSEKKLQIASLALL